MDRLLAIIECRYDEALAWLDEGLEPARRLESVSAIVTVVESAPTSEPLPLPPAGTWGVVATDGAPSIDGRYRFAGG